MVLKSEHVPALHIVKVPQVARRARLVLGISRAQRRVDLVCDGDWRRRKSTRAGEERVRRAHTEFLPDEASGRARDDDALAACLGLLESADVRDADIANVDPSGAIYDCCRFYHEKKEIPGLPAGGELVVGLATLGNFEVELEGRGAEVFRSHNLVQKGAIHKRRVEHDEVKFDAVLVLLGELPRRLLREGLARVVFVHVVCVGALLLNLADGLLVSAFLVKVLYAVGIDGEHGGARG